MSAPATVAVIGGANIDIYGQSVAALRDRDSNPGAVRLASGGVARNVAENLSRLGASTRLFAAVGDDLFGRMLAERSAEAGIDTQCLARMRDQATAIYLSILDEDGDLQVAVSDTQVMDAVNAEYLSAHRADIHDCGLLVVDTNLTEDALGWLAQESFQQPVFADTVSAAKAARLRPHLGMVHTLKTGTAEAEALASRQAETQSDLESLVAWLHERGVRRVYITRGSRGVYYSTGNAQGFADLPGDAPEVRNASGAGDAFLAALALAWLHQWPHDHTLQFALAAAALTIAHDDTINHELTLAAVENHMNQSAT